MWSQHLAVQCPSGHRCFRSPLWRAPQRAFALHKALVSSSAAEVAKRRTRSASTLKVVESLGATVAPLTGTDVGGSNKFFEVYILGKHIGSGAYGQVQLVIERATGQCAAVKLLPKVRGKLSKVQHAKTICPVPPAAVTNVEAACRMSNVQLCIACVLTSLRMCCGELLLSRCVHACAGEDNEEDPERS